MSTIFGNNEDKFNRQGSHTFYSGTNGKSDNIYHAGSSAYGNNGPMYNGGSVSSFGGGQIFHSAICTSAMVSSIRGLGIRCLDRMGSAGTVMICRMQIFATLSRITGDG